MRESGQTTANVPYGADQTVYLLSDGFGRQDIERTNLETVITDLMSGRFHDPMRIVAFNTLEHWSNDISAEVAREIQSRCDSDGLGVPQYLATFMEMHLDPAGHPTRRRGFTERRLNPTGHGR